METTKIFNQLRLDNSGKILKRQELLKILENIPYHYSKQFLGVLCNNGILNRVGRGKYMFTDTPVFHTKLKNALNELKAFQVKYNSRNKNKIEEASDIDSAIALLKEAGYEIYKVEIIKTRV